MSKYFIRVGRWQDVLRDIECDALITDPPYSARVHSGQSKIRDEIKYPPFDEAQILKLVKSWHERTYGWMFAFTSHDLVEHWMKAFAAVGRYHFAPLRDLEAADFEPIPWENYEPLVTRTKVPRFSGDGPGSWLRYMVCARPRTKDAMRWRALPGAYSAAPSRGAPIVGAKSVSLMKEIIRDYSNPGDLVCDPYAGYGSTRLAALELGRRFVGAEINEKVCALANKRQLAREVSE